MKKQKYVDCCWECGNKQYIIKHRDNLSAITVHSGVCSICKKEATIVPARDWRCAARGYDNSADWD